MDSPLTQKGISQALETATKLKNYQFDSIISSPLGRAFETAKILAENLKITKIITNVNLTERHLGVMQGKTKEESIKIFPQFFDENNRFIHGSEIPQGETLKEFLSRVNTVVGELKEISKTSRILVVTHDGVLHAVVGIVNEIEFGDVQNHYKFAHCEPVFL
ncbi:MAG: histidine phosphatase family protein [Patescibacteria group bacterium]